MFSGCELVRRSLPHAPNEYIRTYNGPDCLQFFCRLPKVFVLFVTLLMMHWVSSRFASAENTTDGWVEAFQHWVLNLPM